MCLYRRQRFITLMREEEGIDTLIISRPFVASLAMHSYIRFYWEKYCRRTSREAWRVNFLLGFVWSKSCLDDYA